MLRISSPSIPELPQRDAPERSATTTAAAIPKTAPDAPAVSPPGSTSSAPNDPPSSPTAYSSPNRSPPSVGSSSRPISSRMNMFIPKCSTP